MTAEVSSLLPPLSRSATAVATSPQAADALDATDRVPTSYMALQPVTQMALDSSPGDVAHTAGGVSGQGAAPAASAITLDQNAGQLKQQREMLDEIMQFLLNATGSTFGRPAAPAPGLDPETAGDPGRSSAAAAAAEEGQSGAAVEEHIRAEGSDHT